VGGRALASAYDYQDRSGVWFKVLATVIQWLLGNRWRLKPSVEKINTGTNERQ